MKVYCDGVFDLVHSGHFNAIRQARKMGSSLTVGVCADDDVFRSKKTTPLYTAEERAEIIRGCRWADFVETGTPYDVSSKLLDQFNCKFVAHGTDAVSGVAGTDAYEDCKIHQRYKEFRRTEGISTTQLSIRIQNCIDFGEPLLHTDDDHDDGSNIQSDDTGGGPLQSSVDTLRLLEFIGPDRRPERRHNAKRVVYIWGAFDVLTVYQVRLLQEAKACGDYLVVGLLSDGAIANLYGSNAFPIMSLVERSMNLHALSCVDEVVIGCPLIPGALYLERFHAVKLIIPNIFTATTELNFVDECETHGVINVRKRECEFIQSIIETIGKNHYYPVETVEMSTAGWTVSLLLSRVVKSKMLNASYSEIVARRRRLELSLVTPTGVQEIL